MLFPGKGRAIRGREEIMPNQDRTGPLGQGPMTGNGLGRCGGGQGRGQGGYGMGRGGFCSRMGQGLRRALGFGQGGAGQARGGGFFRFGRFPRNADAGQDPQGRIAALEREIADLKEQLRNR